jgi:hypothetical protein
MERHERIFPVRRLLSNGKEIFPANKISRSIANFCMPRLCGSKALVALTTLSLLATSCSTATSLANPHAPPLESSPDGNLVLVLNNESPVNPPIDFNVFIDGRPSYSKEIGFTPHQMEGLCFKVTKGSHAVYVNSKKVNIWAAQSVEVGEKVWVHISYWHTLDPESGGPFNPHFEISSRLEPIPVY